MAETIVLLAQAAQVAQAAPGGSLLTEAIKQVPALAVLAYLTVQFLKHLKDRDKTFTDELKQIHESGKESRDSNTNAIMKNNEITGRVLATLDRIENREDRLEEMIRELRDLVQSKMT
jgi:hypothetical protein